MRRLALVIINHDENIEYDNYIKDVIKKCFNFLGYKSIFLVNKNATKSKLITQLNGIANTISNKDRFVLYFSGHTIWSPWRKGFRFFDFKAYHVLYRGQKNWLSNIELMNLLEQLKCQKMLLFDTCCGPLIQFHKQVKTQIITVSNKFGKTQSIIDNQNCTPTLAYLLKKMVMSCKNCKSFSKYLEDNKSNTKIKVSISGEEFIF